jgi:hypothetical protein
MAGRELLPFTEDGLLPARDYPLTISALRTSYLVTGVGLSSPTWDIAWRALLVDNLQIMVAQLWQIGIDDVFVAGSFVEEKDHPNDVDGYFACDVRYYASGQLEQALNALDPHSIWTWDNARRRPAPGKAFPQLPMWHQYRVELYPDYGQAFGRLPGGALVMARDWFRRTRDLRRKGIVQIVREVPE